MLRLMVLLEASPWLFWARHVYPPLFRFFTP